jgi:hypothetical protein
VDRSKHRVHFGLLTLNEMIEGHMTREGPGFYAGAFQSLSGDRGGGPPPSPPLLNRSAQALQSLASSAAKPQNVFGRIQHGLPFFSVDLWQGAQSSFVQQG